MSEAADLNERGIKIKEGGQKVSFTVSDMPTLTFLRFKENAKNRFGDCYWCYIQHLLEIEKLYYDVIKRIDDIEDMVSGMLANNDVEIKTLGGGRDGEQVGSADKE